MSLIGELTRVIHVNKYNIITFSVNGTPILTANFLKDRKIILLINNMEELRHYELSYNGDAESFANEVIDVLVYSGIDPMNKKDKRFKYKVLRIAVS